jgi:hypothetical protein
MKVLLLCFLYALLVQADEFTIRRSDIWTQNHAACKVLQGSNLSFLSCTNTFEIYKTDAVAISPYETEMYGEMTPVIGARTTLEVNHPERITWVFNSNQIWTAEVLADGTVVKYKIM